MSCTIVIPHKDRLEHLKWCLRALKHQTTKDYYEIIVVDDGSKILPQDALNTADFPPSTRFIHQDNQGAATARNVGWQASAQDIIIFLDCDQIVSPRFVANHLETFQFTDASFVQLGTRRHMKRGYRPNLATLPQAPALRDERVLFFRQTSYNMAGLEIGWHLGFSHNMAFRRRDLMAQGGFDPAFTGWGFEDCELCYRLQKAGIPLVMNPRLEAAHQWHPQGMTPPKFERWRKNLDYFISKCPTAEVDVQKVLISALNPALQSRIKWTQAILQMEALSRLAVGRPLRQKLAHGVHCNSVEDLHKIARSEACGQTSALLAPNAVELFLAAQMDPALREVRIFWHRS